MDVSESKALIFLNNPHSKIQKIKAPLEENYTSKISSSCGNLKNWGPARVYMVF